VRESERERERARERERERERERSHTRTHTGDGSAARVQGPNHKLSDNNRHTESVAHPLLRWCSCSAGVGGDGALC